MTIRDDAQKIADSIDKPLGIRYTPEGEIMVRRVNGVEVDEPLRMDALHPEYKNIILNAEELYGMSVLDEAIQQIKGMKRVMPVTVKEMVGWKIKKKTLSNLEKHGLIRMVLSGSYNTESGNVMGAVNIVFPTIQGRAFIREVLHADNSDRGPQPS